MNRSLVAAFLASAVAVSLGACSDDSGSSGFYVSGASGTGGSATTCSAYTTCGTCTPVDGCGWCFSGSTGACTSDPDDCPLDASEFTWTWNQSGCPGADASVVLLDAGTSAEASRPEAAPAEASVTEAAAEASGD
jgi:hypothetical protein